MYMYYHKKLSTSLSIFTHEFVQSRTLVTWGKIAVIIIFVSEQQASQAEKSLTSESLSQDEMSWVRLATVNELSQVTSIIWSPFGINAF